MYPWKVSSTSFNTFNQNSYSDSEGIRRAETDFWNIIRPSIYISMVKKKNNLW
jgi:hypothetical protein